MAGAHSSGSKNDEFGHQLIVTDLERLYQILQNEPESVLPLGTDNRKLSIQTISICVNGVEMSMDILGTDPY